MLLSGQLLISQIFSARTDHNVEYRGDLGTELSRSSFVLSSPGLLLRNLCILDSQLLTRPSGTGAYRYSRVEPPRIQRPYTARIDPE